MNNRNIDASGWKKMSVRYIAILGMLLSCISYQLSASFAKQLFQLLDPLSVTILRLCFATIIITIMFRSWRILPSFKSLNWKDLLLYSLSLGLMNICFYYSLSKIPLGVAVGLEFAGPLTLALLLVKQRRDYIWVILAIVGIIGLVPWREIEEFSFIGAFLALSAGFFWACFIHLGQKVVRQNIGMHALSIGIGVSALCFLPIGLWQDAPALFEFSYWKMAFVIAVLATAIPYSLDLYALKFLNKMTYGIVTSLSPAIATLTGLVVLGENLSLGQYLAMCSIACASIGVVVFSHKDEKSV